MEMTVLEFIAVCLSWFCGGIAVKRCVDECRKHRKHSAKEKITIEGWVARDKDEEHATLWDSKPTRDTIGEYWACFGEWLPLPGSSFPSVTWDSEPKKVKVTIEEE